MRLEHLKVKGLTEFTEEVAIDFTAIPDGSLIALVGVNGCGKTSLMEACLAALYRDLPTRGKPMKTYFNGKGYVDAVYRLDNGVRYQAIVKVDGDTGSSDAVLLRLDETGAVRLNDGKVSTFDAAVAEIFPPQSAMLASAFATQNRMGSFATRDQAKRKELFYALLGLHRLEAYAETARAAVRMLEKRIAELRGRRDGLAESTSDAEHDRLQAQAYALTEEGMRAETSKAELGAALAELDSALTSLRADVVTKAATITERAGLEATREEALRRRLSFDVEDAHLATTETTERSLIEGRLAAALKRINSELQALATDAELDEAKRQRLSVIDTDLQTFVAEREARIAKNDGLKKQSDAIRAAVDATNLAHTTIARLRGSLVDLRAAAADTDELDRARVKVGEIETLIEQVGRATRAAELLNNVPCGGILEYASCQFLVDARAAQALLLEYAGRNLAEEREAAVVERDRLVSVHAGIKADIADADKQIREQEQIVATHRDLVALDVHLANAETKIADYNADITAAKEKADRDRTSAKDVTVTARAQRDAASTRLADATREAEDAAALERQALETRMVAVRTKRAEDRRANEDSIVAVDAKLLATAGAADAHAAAVAAVAGKDAERVTLSADYTTACATLARLQEQQEQFHARQERFTRDREYRLALDADITALETELVEWNILAQMMGKDGLAILEIDAAGPGVSARANDLLQASYGGRFAVELVTQSSKADGKGMKEDFDLKVYDHERGGAVRDLTDLSGGQQVIVDEALKAAIALVLNERSDFPVRTCWRDETTGALDDENALNYVVMLRRLHKLAGLGHLLFVSHNSEVAALADVQLHVHDGQVDVLYPPFAIVADSQEAA